MAATIIGGRYVFGGASVPKINLEPGWEVVKIKQRPGSMVRVYVRKKGVIAECLLHESGDLLELARNTRPAQ